MLARTLDRYRTAAARVLVGPALIVGATCVPSGSYVVTVSFLTFTT